MSHVLTIDMPNLDFILDLCLLRLESRSTLVVAGFDVLMGKDVDSVESSSGVFDPGAKRVK